MIKETDIELVAAYLLGTDNILSDLVIIVTGKDTFISNNELDYLHSFVRCCNTCNTWYQPEELLDDVCTFCMLNHTIGD